MDIIPNALVTCNPSMPVRLRPKHSFDVVPRLCLPDHCTYNPAYIEDKNYLSSFRFPGIHRVVFTLFLRYMHGKYICTCEHQAVYTWEYSMIHTI
jgi:hypothetical protein